MDFPNPNELSESIDPEAMEAMRLEKLQAFGLTLGKQRDDWIKARASYGVDKRWSEDEDQYNSKDNIARMAAQMMTSVEQGYPVTTQGATPHRSTVYIGLTRQKSNAAEARLADILLPTDDRNWGIQPTPDPEIAGHTKDDGIAVDKSTMQPVPGPDGQPIEMKKLVRSVMEEARKKAEAMQTEIEDQLIECDYNGELRKMIHDAVVLGTGVIKGPIVTNRARRSWQTVTDDDGNTIQKIVMVDEINPASFHVAPQNVWPDPACGDSIHKGKGIYEREKLTGKQVRDLAKQNGYMKDQLRTVLEEGPKRSAALEELQGEDSGDLLNQTYEKWTYWGEVDHDDLESAGVSNGEKDILKSVSACVIMINSTVVKAFLNPLEGGDIPYDFYVWEKVARSVWGYGIPYMMRPQQKVLNAAWRQMMDNAGVSSGPQIVIKPSVIQPADKQWTLSSRKIWYATDDLEDVNKAFSTFEFDSHQTELSNIIQMAMELSDAESGVPTIAQGEQGTAPDTVGGMQLLMASANVVLRRLVKQFDDMVTRPHIRRYYDYNMLYNPDEEIKGDYCIDARGSSALIVRDIQNQAFMNLLAAGANPVYSVFLDSEKLFRKALQAQHIDPADVFKPEGEIEDIKAKIKQAEAQGAPPDPRVEAANIRAQTDLQKAQVQNEGDMAEIESRRQARIEESQMRREELMMSREIEMLKMANAQQVSLEKIKAQLADTTIKERSKQDLFVAERDLKLQAGSGI